MKVIFSSITQRKVSEKIVEQIISLIKEGKLSPGDRLPPERLFAEQLGVGRSSLREAMNKLDTLGFIEIKKRQGAFIKSMSTKLLEDPLSKMLAAEKGKLPQLYELRKDIELASCYWAAKRRTGEDVFNLKTILDRMEKDAGEGGLLLKDDLEFHMAIAEASHNFLRVHILHTIFEMTNVYIDFIRRKIIQQKKNVPAIFNQHQSIFRSIEKGKSENAQDEMKQHLMWVEKQISMFPEESDDFDPANHENIYESEVMAPHNGI